MTGADIRRIRTDVGVLELAPVTIDEVRSMARYWPMEVIADRDVPPHFGLVFQHGEHEVSGVKMQPADMSGADAGIALQVNRALVASALHHYLARNHKGVMVPCAYYRPKHHGMAEAGIACFVGPDAESGSRAQGRTGVEYDDRLGKGATQMVFDMAGAIAAGSRECGLPPMTVIGIDVRNRLAIGGLAMDFAVVGSSVFVITDPLQEDEPIWEYVVRAGFSRLPHAPMKPIALGPAPPGGLARG